MTHAPRQHLTHTSTVDKPPPPSATSFVALGTDQIAEAAHQGNAS